MSTLLHTPSSRLTNDLERDLMSRVYAVPQPISITPALRAIARTISRIGRALWQGAIRAGEIRAARAIQQRQYWY